VRGCGSIHSCVSGRRCLLGVPPASCPRCFPLQSPACRCVSPFPRRLEPCACTRRQLPSTTAAGPQAAAGSVASLPQKFPVPRQDRTVQGFPFYFFLAQNCANLWRCRNHRTVYDLPTMPLRQSFRPKNIYLTLLAGAMVLQYSSCQAHHVRCVVHQTGTPPPICHASLLVPPPPQRLTANGWDYRSPRGGADPSNQPPASIYSPAAGAGVSTTIRRGRGAGGSRGSGGTRRWPVVPASVRFSQPPPNPSAPLISEHGGGERTRGL
jgi:hypothetical protein